MEQMGYIVWKAYDCTGEFMGLFAVHHKLGGAVGKWAAEEIDKYLGVEHTEFEVDKLEHFLIFAATDFDRTPVIDLTAYYQFAVEKLYMPEEEACSFLRYLLEKNTDILTTVMESMETGCDGPIKFEFNYTRLSEKEWSEIIEELDELKSKLSPFVWTRKDA